MSDFIEQHKDDIWLQIIVALIIVIIIIWIVSFIRYLIYRVKRNSKATPFLIRGNQNANKAIVLYQDPSNLSSIPVLRSRDELDGIEFSYTTWLYVDDWINYKKGEWKSVFHKGSPNAWPPENTSARAYNKFCGAEDDPSGAMIAAPGVWFHPNNNAMRIYMNSFSLMNDYVDIFNVPSNKWFHLGIILRHQALDIYINGYLKKKHTLASIARQNFGNVYIGTNGGFQGYISNLRYFDYAITVNELTREVERGPSTLACNDISGNQPPYLNTNWWQVRYNQTDPPIRVPAVPH